jgi:hypothetical protein
VWPPLVKEEPKMSNLGSQNPREPVRRREAHRAREGGASWLHRHVHPETMEGRGTYLIEVIGVVIMGLLIAFFAIVFAHHHF